MKRIGIVMLSLMLLVMSAQSIYGDVVVEKNTLDFITGGKMDMNGILTILGAVILIWIACIYVIRSIRSRNGHK